MNTLDQLKPGESGVIRAVGGRVRFGAACLKWDLRPGRA